MQKFNNNSKDYSVTQYLNIMKKNNDKLLFPQVSQDNKQDKNSENFIQQLQPDRTRKGFDKFMQGKFDAESDPMIIKSLGFADEELLNNQGGYKTITQKKSELAGMSNDEIKKIIDNKRKNILSIVYESVQISLRSKNVILKANKSLSQKVKQKKNVSKVTPEQKDNLNFNVPGLKFPQINKKNQQKQTEYLDNQNQNLQILPNKLEQQKKINQEQKKIDRHFSQEINPKKQNIFRRRSDQNEKLFQTFYEYEKLIQKKQQQALKQWRERNNKDKSKQKFLFINFQDHKIPSRKENFQSQPLIAQPIRSDVPTSAATKLQASNQQKNLKNTDVFKNSKKKKNTQTPIIIRQLVLKETTVYSKKISAYREFIFLVNFAHNRFDPLILKDDHSLNRNDLRYKAYVGKGNNSLLLKSLLKRRYWWTLQEDSKNSNFAWTQLKINSFFQDQKSNFESTEIQNFFTTSKSNIFRLSQKALKRELSKDQISQKTRYKSSKPVISQGISKIFSQSDEAIYQKYTILNLDTLKMEDYQQRIKYLEKKLIPISQESRSKYKMHNHLQYNYFIGNKKALFYNLRQYYQLTNKNVFDYIPLTFHIKNGIEDGQYKNFVRYFKKRELAIKSKQEQEEEEKKLKKKKKKPMKNIWIVKPGENSNRGNGITVIDQIYELNKILKKREKHHNGIQRTYIVQAYIQKPLLYHKRKFDIRHYMLITTLYGKMKGYWYRQGYIRTSSYQFDLDDLGNSLIHLTNDAIQKHGNNYGKYEEGNKISYLDFQKYLDHTFPQKKYNFYQSIYPKMKQIAKDSIRSSYLRLDPKKLEHNFQIFGLDFMIDDHFNVWLIEINTNPCLEISSSLLGRIIPTMVQHSFRLSLDIIFPPYAHYPNTQKHLAPQSALESLKYELIFDQQSEGAQLQQLYQNKLKLDCGQIDEQQQIYLDQGRQCEQQVIT